MTTIIVLAGGQGKRMKTDLPKILHPLGGKAMIHHVLDTALALHPQQVIVVLSPSLDSDQVRGGRPVDVVVQEQALGTGDSVKTALPLIKNFQDDVLVLCGDTPLIEPSTVQSLLDRRQEKGKGDSPEIFMLAMDLDDCRQYGRLRTTQDHVNAIVEHKDATPEEHKIRLCNSGIFLIPGPLLEKVIPLLEKKNAAGEYYLTDVVHHGRVLGVKTRFVVGDKPYQLHGINTLIELAEAESCLQQRWREQWMLSGVVMMDPSTVYLSHDTVIGANTLIYPNVFIGPGVSIGEHVVLYPGCYLQKTTLKSHTKVGPYAHLRDGTILEMGAEIGNFVECKKSHFQPKAKAKHLAYLGDAQVGESANVGAGTITCNYNGFVKSQTIIGAGAFIGSNSSLVAPIRIGDNAIVGAGSTISKDVPEGALALERGDQIIKQGWVRRYREIQTKNKELKCS